MRTRKEEGNKMKVTQHRFHVHVPIGLLTAVVTSVLLVGSAMADDWQEINWN